MKSLRKLSAALFALVIVAVMLLLVACSSGNSYEYDSVPQAEGGYYKDTAENVSAESGETTPERKIIYTAEISLTVDDIEQKIAACDALLAADEWQESAYQSENRCTLTYRIKSSRLSDFLDAVALEGKVTNFTKSSTDVSLNYYDNTAQKEIYLAEQTRLKELLEKASNISEIIAINTRLSQIDVELKEINGLLNQYDSLVEYSTVTVYLNTTYVEQKASFGSRLASAFSEGWDFAQNLFIFLLVLIPFAAVVGGITVGIIVGVKKAKAKKKRLALPKEDSASKQKLPATENNRSKEDDPLLKEDLPEDEKK